MNEKRKIFLQKLFQEPIYLAKEKFSLEDETSFSDEENENPHTGLFAQMPGIPVLENISASIGILCDVTHDNVEKELLPQENELLKKILDHIPLNPSDIFIMLLDFEKVTAEKTGKIISSLHSENSISVLLAFGENISIQFFRKPLSHARGKIQSLHGIPLICTHKLQALINDEPLKRETMEDIKLLRTLLPH